MKPTLISLLIKLLMGGAALGLGIWYVSSSIDGGALGYSSVGSFLNAIGVKGGDISMANGCFLCGYIEQLFGVIGAAAENFWTAMVNNLWIIMALGFGVFLFISAANHIYDATKTTAKLDTSEKKIDFGPWFDKVWKQGLRIMIAGVLIGALGAGGNATLRTVANITITPVMFVGAELSMAATGVSDAAQCMSSTTLHPSSFIHHPLSIILHPFMCVMGNLNTVMLAGAAGGFALMNYAWMDMGGGALTWVAGLALVIMFLMIGFDLFFSVLTVIFKLVFLIIFLPLIIALAAFEGTWDIAKGVLANAVEILVKSAVQILGITLKTLVLFAIVNFAADEYFPGPRDGYNSILPPLISQQSPASSPQSLSVMSVFETCEAVSITNGIVDKDKFKDCFTARRAEVERQYPGAFDFMRSGWEFLMLMMGLFILYFYAVKPKIDKLLGGDAKSTFDFGGWIKDMGTAVWNIPAKITEQLTKKK